MSRVEAAPVARGEDLQLAQGLGDLRAQGGRDAELGGDRVGVARRRRRAGRG
jgi:hypothetical protein